MSKIKKIVFDNSLFGKYAELIYEKNILGYEILDYIDCEKEISIYLLYEYSDDIQLISDNFIFPSVINYVKTGLLTQEEIIEALLI